MKTLGWIVFLAVALLVIMTHFQYALGVSAQMTTDTPVLTFIGFLVRLLTTLILSWVGAWVLCRKLNV